MFSFIIRRLVSAFFVMFSISVMVFLIFFATPGVNPAARIAGRSASPQVLAQVSAEFGLNRPLPIRYALMMWHLFFKQDLTSYVNIGVKVIPQITGAAPVTLSLIVGAAVIWLVVGVALGVVAAANRGKWIDPLIMFGGIAAVSIPVFWLGQVVSLLIQRKFHSVFSWLPGSGFVPLTQSPWQWALHLLLPWLTLATLYAGVYARVLRAELVNAMNEDYVRTARAKGLAETAVMFRHVLKNGMIPILTGAVVVIPSLFMGALITESFFGIPGLGSYTIDAIQAQDFSVVRSMVFLGSVLYIAGLLLTDISYTMVDPRVRFE